MFYMVYDMMSHIYCMCIVAQCFIFCFSLVQDLFRAGIGAVLYIITSLICVIGGSGDGARIAGGVSKMRVTQFEFSSFHVRVCLF